MNARQKAKLWKKRYEDLIKQPVRHFVTTHPVDTLHLKKRYPMEMACENPEAFEKLVRNDMKQEIAEKIEPYIEWRLENDVYNSCYLLDFQVKVVSRNEVISSLAGGVQTPLIEVMHG